MLPDLELGEIVRLRKAHPCGSAEWKVVRLGADIGLECTGCGRRILIPRRQLAQRMKKRAAGGGTETTPGGSNHSMDNTQDASEL
jgi:hypothetical protein